MVGALEIWRYVNQWDVFMIWYKMAKYELGFKYHDTAVG